MTREEVISILSDVSSYLASLSTAFPNDELAGHTYHNICVAITEVKKCLKESDEMTREERQEAIAQLKRISRNLASIGETVDYTDLAIEALEQTRWISVSERLPEEMGTYMTTIDYGKYGIVTGQRYYYGQNLWDDDCVIAWMPLPQPYKVESEGRNEQI